MIISIIAAMGNDRVIGINNQLPWKLPADMKFFRSTTMGKPIIMGRKTYESIGKPLPGRTNIIITRDLDFHAEGCIVAHSIEEALKQTGATKEVMIIGGASLYKQVLPLAQRFYLTRVHADFEGDSYFPEFNPQEWSLIERTDHEADERNAYDYSFLVMDKNHKP